MLDVVCNTDDPDLHLEIDAEMRATKALSVAIQLSQVDNTMRKFGKPTGFRIVLRYLRAVIWVGTDTGRLFTNLRI